jgi:hypothetical protein
MILIWDLEGGHEPSMTLIGKIRILIIIFYLTIEYAYYYSTINANFTVLGHEEAITCFAVMPNYDIVSGSVDKYVHNSALCRVNFIKITSHDKIDKNHSTRKTTLFNFIFASFASFVTITNSITALQYRSYMARRQVHQSAVRSHSPCLGCLVFA